MIEDAFGKKTYAEEQRDKYRKIVNGLQEQLKRKSGEVQEQLAGDYNIMERNPDSAQGKMELMKQYHKSFSNKNSENPVKQAIDALEAHGQRVDDFYTGFKEYKDMEGM